MFYLLAGALLLLGAGVVVLALRRRENVATVGRETTVAVLYQDRLDELRREMANGQAEVEDRAVLEAELGAALLSDYDSDSSNDAATTGHEAPDSAAATGPLTNGGHHAGGVALMIASSALLIAITVLVYGIVGDPHAMQLAGAERALQLDPTTDQAALTDWRERLRTRVERKPADAKSWYLLGHVDLKLGQFATAAEAFAMAYEAYGEDPSIDLFWLQARYMAAGAQLDSTSRAIADRVLARNPSQPLVLEIYAIDAFRQGDFRKSVSLLNRALSGSLDAGHRASLNAGFQEARKQLGDLPPAVDVEISTAGNVPAGMTLFVIARPIGGGMPFAVVRRPATDLPRTIRLDDAVSMNPAAPLSNAPEVEVVVRLSQSGTAMAHPGDWEWHSEPLTPAELAQPLQLTALLTPPS